MGWPFLVAFLCWVGINSLTNPFELDWVTLKCMHMGCAENQRMMSWGFLAAFVLALGATVVFAVGFITRYFFTFAFFLVLAGALVAFAFSLATSAGDASVFDHRVTTTVTSFMVYMMGAMTFAARQLFSRGKR